MSICTQETKRCKYKKYIDTKIVAECCHNNLRSMLYYFDDLAKILDVTYFLDFGTLLGSVRHGDIISYDTDIDISIFHTDKDKLKLMIPYFKNMGFILRKHHKHKTLYKLFYGKKNKLHIDIHLRKLNNDNVYYSNYSVENWGIHKDYLFPLKYNLFGNRMLPIPNKYEDYLEHGYGKGCIDNPKRKGEYRQKF